MLGARPHRRRRRPAQPGEIVLLKGAGWYDYEAKYTRGRHGAAGARADLATPRRERVRELARRAPSGVAGCSGLARVDFFVDGETCCSTSSTRCPARPRRASTRSSGRPAASPYPELLDRLVDDRASSAARARARARASSLREQRDLGDLDLLRVRRQLRDPDQVVAEALAGGVERDRLARPDALRAADELPAGVGDRWPAGPSLARVDLDVEARRRASGSASPWR